MSKKPMVGRVMFSPIDIGAARRDNDDAQSLIVAVNSRGEDLQFQINAALSLLDQRIEALEAPPLKGTDYTCPVCKRVTTPGVHGRPPTGHCQCQRTEIVAAANACIAALKKERDEARRAAEGWKSSAIAKDQRREGREEAREELENLFPGTHLAWARDVIRAHVFAAEKGGA